MGKIRIKTYGEEVSQEEKEQKRQEKEAKKATKIAASKTVAQKEKEEKKAEPSVSVPVKEEEKAKPEVKAEEKKEKKEKFKKEKKAKGKKYTANISKVKKDNTYPLDKAIELLKSMSKSKFDETVELHINVKEKGVSGQVTLPHGTGKKVRIAIANDEIIGAVSKGKIDFDILVAEPQMMGKLAKVARILGPRGLMPNPKAGTISPKPQEVVEKLSKGQINFKTESDMPIIHMSVGKLSFNDKQLSENITTALSAIGATKINSVTLKSTMSPAIKLHIE